jgi:hypothetical protein
MLRLCEIGQGDDRETERKKKRATDRKVSGFCGCQMMDDGIEEVKKKKKNRLVFRVYSLTCLGGRVDHRNVVG